MAESGIVSVVSLAYTLAFQEAGGLQQVFQNRRLGPAPPLGLRSQPLVQPPRQLEVPVDLVNGVTPAFLFCHADIFTLGLHSFQLLFSKRNYVTP
jgi:hypothetical protein